MKRACVRLVDTYEMTIRVLVRGRGFVKRTVYYATVSLAGQRAKIRISKETYRKLRV